MSLNGISKKDKIIHDLNSNIGSLLVSIMALQSRLSKRDFEGCQNLLSLILAKRETISECLNDINEITKRGSINE